MHINLKNLDTTCWVYIILSVIGLTAAHLVLDNELGTLLDK